MTLSPIKKDRSPSDAVIDDDKAALIKGMLGRGDKQQDIAAFFGINGGRIAEINTHQRFRFVKAAAPSELPPRGPYATPVAMWQLVREIKDLRQKLDDILRMLGEA